VKRTLRNNEGEKIFFVYKFCTTVHHIMIFQVRDSWRHKVLRTAVCRRIEYLIMGLQLKCQAPRCKQCVSKGACSALEAGYEILRY
jgi:hypothetical protein